ncbi:hypothetical protein [Halomicrococcus gelatinilyticus]|uniref:hypothetical protein n=1 Tax=Halomicrococcus gelatinilyticus TaxID=1702103 RepID=UPI002E11204C
MSVASSFSRWLRQRRFDVDAAIVALVLALAMLPLRLILDQIYVKTIPIVLGLGAALYLLAARNEDETTVPFPTVSRPVAQLLPSLVFVLSAALVALGFHAGERTVLFHVVSGLAGTLIVLQILFTDDDQFLPALLLVEVLTLAVVVRFVAVYTTPSYIGIDIWTHLTHLAGGVLEQHSLAAMDGNKHIAAPLFHVLVASASMLYDVSLRNALYLSVGVAVPASILFVYAATRLLVPARWAVFAAMLYSVSDYFIEWGIHLIPTSHGLLFFLAIVYALLRIMELEYGARDFGLLVFLSIAIILTHQVSTFIMLVVLGSGLVAQFALRFDLFKTTASRPGVYRTLEPVNLAGLLAFDVGLITFMWSFTPYNGDSFLETVLLYLAETLRSSAGLFNTVDPSAEGIDLPPPTLTARVVEYVDTLGFLVLFGLTVVGCLYVLRRRRVSHSVFTLLVATVVMTVFTLGLPLMGIRNFIPQRWFAFLYATMAILSALGVGYLVHNLDRRVAVAALVLVALVYPPMMVMSGHGALDSPVFASEQERLTYTEPEMAAVDSIAAMTGSPDSSNVLPRQVAHTDHPYQTVFKRTGAYPADAVNLSVDGGPVDHPVTVYRTYQSTGAPKFLLVNESNGASVPARRTVDRERVCRPDQSVLYSNGQVVMCSTPTM